MRVKSRAQALVPLQIAIEHAAVELMTAAASERAGSL
jgi:hypothetical protein